MTDKGCVNNDRTLLDLWFVCIEAEISGETEISLKSSELMTLLNRIKLAEVEVNELRTINGQSIERAEKAEAQP
jgi:hypothetical protein